MSNLKEQVNKTAALLNDIKSALEDQGVDTTNMVPRDYANAVRNIVNNITVENISLIPILIFQYSATRPTKPDGGSWNSETGEITLPDGWYSDISLDYESANKTEPLWMSNAVFSSSGEVYKTWSTPIRISGRDGVDGERGPAGLPGTTAGVTQFFNYPIFHIGTSAQPATPNVTYDTIERELSIPDGWTETIERNDYNGVVWQSYLKYNTDNNPPVACTVPIRMTAESSVVTGNIRYYQLSDSRTVPNKGTSSWNIWTEDIDIAPTRTRPYLFCYDVTVYSESNRVSSPVYLMAIYTAGLLDIDVAYAVGRESTVRKGENESDEYYNERFGQFWFTSSEEAISADTEKEAHPDDENFAYYRGLTENTLYLWCRETFEYEDHIDQFYRIISYYKAAEKAPVLYSAGVYNDLVHYTRNEDQCPYVFYPAGLYLDENENVETKTVDGETVPKTEEDAPTGTKYQYFFLKNSYENNESFDSFFEAYQNKKWKKIDSFEAIYSDIGILKAAQVGKFVYDDKYMFSMYGKDGQTGSIQTRYEDYTDTHGQVYDNETNGFKTRTGVSVAIDAAVRNTDSDKKFIPGTLIDAVTGESWFANGNAKFYYDGDGDLADRAIAWRHDNSGKTTLYIDGDVKIGTKAPAHSYDGNVTEIGTSLNELIAEAQQTADSAQDTANTAQETADDALDAANAANTALDNINYLKNTFGTVTDINGVTLSKAVAVKNSGGSVVGILNGGTEYKASLSGQDNTPIVFATGVNKSSQSTLANKVADAKFIVYETGSISIGGGGYSGSPIFLKYDGSGHLAKGNIVWNAAGGIGIGADAPTTGVTIGGNVTIKGHLDGATGSFKGTLSGSSGSFTELYAGDSNFKVTIDAKSGFHASSGVTVGNGCSGNVALQVSLTCPTFSKNYHPAFYCSKTAGNGTLSAVFDGNVQCRSTGTSSPIEIVHTSEYSGVSNTSHPVMAFGGYKYYNATSDKQTDNVYTLTSHPFNGMFVLIQNANGSEKGLIVKASHSISGMNGGKERTFKKGKSAILLFVGSTWEVLEWSNS